MFVEDDHALTQPSTMNLISKALVEFFCLGQGAEETDATSTIEREAEEKDSPSSERNVEVKVPLLPYCCNSGDVAHASKVYCVTFPVVPSADRTPSVYSPCML